MLIHFFERSLYEDSKARIESVRMYIKRIPLTDLDGIDKDAFAKQVAEQYQYGDLPTFSADGAERDEPVFASNSPYARVTVYFPYTGDAQLFRLYGDTRPASPPPPVFEALDGFLSKTYDIPKDKLDSIDQLVKHEHSGAERFYAHVRRMAPEYNKEILNAARSILGDRLRELSENKAAQAKLNESKIAVRKRTDESARVLLPPKRTQLSIAQLKTTIDPVREFVLGISEYDDILKTISSMVTVMERSPSVFASMDEESLRTILLVALNGLYEGQATGETFNGHGKTDILIRREDRNVFIAECLMWQGPAYITSKMNQQLFKYAIWRDSKLALIVFSRGVNFTHVVKTMQTTIESHPQFVRKMEWKHETGFRYEFRRHDDPSRHFVLTAIAFSVPNAIVQSDVPPTIVADSR
jgi:hypothetical protein